MLQRKIYALATEGCEIQIFLRDQNRWIKSATVHTIDQDLVILRYRTENNGEISTWEEMVRVDSIGAISRKLPDHAHLATSRVNRSPAASAPNPAPDLSLQSPNQTPDHLPVNG
ncbi:MAG: DUF6679 family protein [Cyanobacteria bacterium J06614_10]